MQIGELAQRSGLSIDTLRFYEKRGLIDERHFRRLPNGYRDYAEHTVERLQLIKGAQAAGFSLAEIGALFASWERNQLTPDDIRTEYGRKLAELDARRRELDQIERYIREKLGRMDAE